MSEESFLLCDGAGCAKAVAVAVAVSDGWWQVRALQHNTDEASEMIEMDLCPECFAHIIGDSDQSC
jgi:hypothetical protein